MYDKKFLKTFESFDSELINKGSEYLIEDKWEKYVPKKVNVKINGEKAKYEIRDKIKNMNSIILTYNLYDYTSNTLANTLTFDISFKEKNTRIDMPLEVSFETVVEVTMGTRYLMGVKIYDGNKTMDYIERQGKIDNNTLSSIADLIKYVTKTKGIKL